MRRNGRDAPVAAICTGAIELSGIVRPHPKSRRPRSVVSTTKETASEVSFRLQTSQPSG